MKKEYSIIPYQQKIEKPWGYELIISSPDLPYTGKILHVKPGFRGSLQYHDQKTETLTLIKGEALLIIEDRTGEMKEVKMEPFMGYTIIPNQKHRFQGITDCDIVEHSTPEVGNTVRLEDDYSRGTETEESRKTRYQDGVYKG